MIAKMNYKFQSGLKMLNQAIQPIKNVISDPLLTSEIECAAVILRCITDDFIDYVKIQDGELDEQRNVHNIREVVHQVCQTYSIQAKEKGGVKLQIQFNQLVPEYLSMNANRFQQVLNNLLNNALRATKFGQITIIIKYKQQTNKLICEVQDSGEGISNQA